LHCGDRMQWFHSYDPVGSCPCFRFNGTDITCSFGGAIGRYGSRSDCRHDAGFAGGHADRRRYGDPTATRGPRVGHLLRDLEERPDCPADIRALCSRQAWDLRLRQRRVKRGRHEFAQPPAGDRVARLSRNCLGHDSKAQARRRDHILAAQDPRVTTAIIMTSDFFPRSPIQSAA
jgi:hypothetical protein